MAIAIGVALVLAACARSADEDDGDSTQREPGPAIERRSPPSFETGPEPTPRTLRGGAVRTPEAGGSQDASKPRRLLPDLEVMPTGELYVEGEEGSRTLRFSTTVLNSGDGPLELIGRPDLERGTVRTSQRIYLDDGSAVSREVGEFTYHAGHAHWHVEDFTMVEVWSLDDDDELDEIVASTGKGTFCAVDEIPELDNADEPAYFDCGGAVQGISAGWSDTYGAEIMGQELDISGLDDGRYAIRSIVDPDNNLREADKTNNSYTAIIELRGDVIEILRD